MISVIINILIYVFFACAMSFMAKQSLIGVEEGKYAINKLDPWLWGMILFFSFFTGVRWAIGADYFSYVGHFANGLEQAKNNELGWLYLANFVHDSGLHWSFGLIITAFLQIFFIVIALKRYRYLLVYLPFVLFGCRYFFDMTNVSRQMIVACAFLWSIKFIVNRQYIQYFAFVFIASLLHHSALLLLPLIFIPKTFDISNYRAVTIGFLLVCVVLGMSPSFSNLLEPLQSIVGMTEYEDAYGDRMKQLLIEGGDDDHRIAFGPMMTAYVVVQVLILWYGKELHDKFIKLIPAFNYWFIFAYIYACGYFLGYNLTDLFIRPVMGIELCQMAMMTLLLYYIWTQYTVFLKDQIVAYFLCAVIATNLCFDIYKATGVPDERSTYKWIFNKKHDPTYNMISN